MSEDNFTERDILDSLNGIKDAIVSMKTILESQQKNFERLATELHTLGLGRHLDQPNQQTLEPTAQWLWMPCNKHPGWFFCPIAKVVRNSPQAELLRDLINAPNNQIYGNREDATARKYRYFQWENSIYKDTMVGGD